MCDVCGSHYKNSYKLFIIVEILYVLYTFYDIFSYVCI